MVNKKEKINFWKPISILCMLGIIILLLQHAKDNANYEEVKNKLCHDKMKYYCLSKNQEYITAFRPYEGAEINQFDCITDDSDRVRYSYKLKGDCEIIGEN